MLHQLPENTEVQRKREKDKISPLCCFALLVYFDFETRSCSLSTCPHSHWQVSISAYFFGIPTYSEDQVRHPALWSKQPLDSWTFSW